MLSRNFGLEHISRIAFGTTLIMLLFVAGVSASLAYPLAPPGGGGSSSGGAGGGNSTFWATSLEIRGEVFDALLPHIPNATGCVGTSCVASWNAYDFAGFWYDLKDDLMSEDMTIVNISSRTIDKDKLLYNATVRAVQFKVYSEKNLNVENGLNAALVKDAVVATDGHVNVIGGGYYAKIGWQAEEYVALNGKASKLAKIVYEQEATDKKTLTIGEVWDIGDGYTLTAQSIDTSTSPRQVWLAFSKDGLKLDDKVIVQGQTYTYTKNSLAGEIDVPVFVTYVDSVFAGETTDIIQLKYTWVVSSSFLEIKTGDKYGVMEVIEDGSNGIIKLRNTDSSINLSQNSVVDLMGNMKFSVADNASVLRFYPIVIRTTPGMVVKRGEVVDTATSHYADALGCRPACTSSWNAYNFAGFWYDLKDDLMSENLKIVDITSRTIDKDKLLYNATVQAVQFKVNSEKNLIVENGLNAALVKDAVNATDGAYNVTGGGYYAKIGWQAQEYVALNGKGNKLAKIIYEQTATDNKTLTIGDVWDIGDGYTLNAKEINTSTSPKQVRLNLSKDGVKLDEKIIVQGQVYTYTKALLANETDVPIFVTYVDSVFPGATTDIIQLKYTWAISTTVTEIKAGDKFGVMEVIEDGSNGIIKLRNTDSSVSLSMNSVVDIMGNMKFSVADSATLRFYPMIEYKIVGEVVDDHGIEIYLQNGWNLISLPLVPLDSNDKENTSIRRITSSISDNIIKIVSYNTTALTLGKPPWEVYYPGDEVNSTLKELKTGQGYFIKMNKATYLNIYGVRVYDNTPRSYNYIQGWNLMGYPSTSTIPVESALYNIQGDFSSLWMLQNEWRSYFGQQFYYMEPGYGYWIFMKRSGEVPQN